MKKTALFLVFSLFFIPLFAQQPQLGLPGDNLDLYGVLNIFQNSPTLEDFERSLNSPDSKVNNLDLNGDGQIDYLRVIDNVNGPVHDIVLRDDINANESQDVAVIEVQRDANNQVHVQIVGDEALYGKNYIVEPQQNTPNPGYRGNVVVNRTYYAPDSWAIIRFMFAPAYVIWNSPFHWGFFPHFWHPWHPVSYNVYYGYPRPYYNYYRRTNYFNSPMAHAYYMTHRANSPYVKRTYPARPEPSPRGHQESPPVHQINRENRPVEQIHQTPNNQNRQINQTSHPVNNQNRQINQTSHQGNNQTQKIHQTSHPENNQNQKIHQTPHTTTHQTSHPNKTNTREKEPERK